MEKKSNVTSKDTSVCEKIFNALSMSSGYVTRQRIRHHEQINKPHVNQQPPRNYAVTSNLQVGDHRRHHYGHVPIVFEGHSNHTKVGANHVTADRKSKEDNMNVSGKKISTNIRVERADSVGGKSRVNNGVKEHAFPDYIDHDGSRIRAGTNVGLRRKDSLNSKVSDYINRTKIRFQSPSYAYYEE